MTEPKWQSTVMKAMRTKSDSSFDEELEKIKRELVMPVGELAAVALAAVLIAAIFLWSKPGFAGSKLYKLTRVTTAHSGRV